MYVITIITPSNDNPNKNVKTYYCGQTINRGVQMTEWDEDIQYAMSFTNKINALKIRSFLRTLKGSESAKIELKNKFSKS